MSAAPSPTHYDTLQLAPTATTGEVREAWRRLAARHHPDRGGEADAQAMARINEAYRVLSDPHERARYDALLWPRPPVRRRTLRQAAVRARRVRWAMLVLLPLAAAATAWGLLRAPASGAGHLPADAKQDRSWPVLAHAPAGVAREAPANADEDQPLQLIAAPRIESWTRPPAPGAR